MHCAVFVLKNNNICPDEYKPFGCANEKKKGEKILWFKNKF